MQDYRKRMIYWIYKERSETLREIHRRSKSLTPNWTYMEGGDRSKGGWGVGISSWNGCSN